MAVLWSIKSSIMKNDKHVIQVVNEFPGIIYGMKLMLKAEENTSFILDASNYSPVLSLINVTEPDYIQLNLRLPIKASIEQAGIDLVNNTDLSVGVITSNSGAYYLSLCKTFSEIYLCDESQDIESISLSIANQQLN